MSGDPNEAGQMPDTGEPSGTWKAVADAIAQIPVVELRGDLFDGVIAVPASMMSLVLGVGSLMPDGRRTLVPFVEMKIAGANPEGEPGLRELFAQVVTFENAAFVVASLATDIAAVCEVLGSMSEGELRPEANRVYQALLFLRQARESIDDGMSHLDQSAVRAD